MEQERRRRRTGRAVLSDFQERLLKRGLVAWMILLLPALAAAGFVPEETAHKLQAAGLVLLGLAGLPIMLLVTWRGLRPDLFLLPIALWSALLAILVFLTGGRMNEFSPLFYLVLIFAGAYFESLPAIAVSILLAALAHGTQFTYGTPAAAHEAYVFAGVVIPSYAFVALGSHYFLGEARHERVQKIRAERLSAELRRKTKQLEELLNIAIKVSTPLNSRRVLDTVAASAAEATGCEFSIIRMLDPGGSTLRAIAGQGFTGKALRALPVLESGEGLAGWVAETGRHLVAPRTSAGASDRTGEIECLASALAVPLTLGARTIGVLTIGSKEDRDFTKDDVDFATALASQAAIAIENARLHETATELSRTDVLTGLANRLRLKQELDQETERARRHGRKLSFAMIDIDNFKVYNDTHGHPLGDEVLRQIAWLLSRTVRGVDLVGRYGGEELCVLMPETSSGQALEVAERLRSAVETFSFAGEETQPGGKLTISIGIATLPEDAVSENALIEAADRALYQAKAAGRNVVRTLKHMRRAA